MSEQVSKILKKNKILTYKQQIKSLWKMYKDKIKQTFCKVQKNIKRQQTDVSNLQSSFFISESSSSSVKFILCSISIVHSKRLFDIFSCIFKRCFPFLIQNINIGNQKCLIRNYGVSTKLSEKPARLIQFKHRLFYQILLVMRKTQNLAPSNVSYNRKASEKKKSERSKNEQPSKT